MKKVPKYKKRGFFVGGLAKFFCFLRFRTTFTWHQKLTKLKWYKTWHEFKPAGLFHFGVLALYILGLSFFVTATPNRTYAALIPANISATSEVDFHAGQTIGTQITQTDDGEVTIGTTHSAPALSESNGGSWGYRVPIAIDNTGGSEKTDTNVRISSTKDKVADWRLDEGSGTAVHDSSITNNTGVLSVGTTGVHTGVSQGWASGRSADSEAVSFDGVDDVITIPNNDGYNFGPNDFTISTWVYFNYTPKGYQIILDKRGQSGYSGWMLYLESNGVLSFLTSESNSGWSNSVLNGSGYVPPAKTWLQVVVTRVGNHFSLYSNGQLISEGDNSSAIAATDADMTIGLGHAYADADNGFDGKMNNIEFYDRGLSANEITGSYKETNSAIFRSSKPDGSDLRFTDSDGETELPTSDDFVYTATNQKKEYDGYIKVPTIPAGSIKTIYLYFGNDRATTQSRSSDHTNRESLQYTLGDIELFQKPDAFWLSPGDAEHAYQLTKFATWGDGPNFNANVSVPTGKNIAFAVRFSEAAGEEGKWGSWHDIGSADGTGDFASQAGDSNPFRELKDQKYIQVRAVLVGTVEDSPALNSIAIHYLKDENSPTISGNPVVYTNTNKSKIVADHSHITNIKWNKSCDEEQICPPRYYASWNIFHEPAEETGVADYYVYFGPDNTADPEVSGFYTKSTEGYIYVADDSSPENYLRIKAYDKVGNFYITPTGESLFTLDNSDRSGPRYQGSDTNGNEPITVTPLSGYSDVNSFNFTWEDYAPGFTDQDNDGPFNYFYTVVPGTYAHINDAPGYDDLVWTEIQGGHNSINDIQAVQRGFNTLFVSVQDLAGNYQIEFYKGATFVWVPNDAPTAPANPSPDGQLVAPISSNINSFTFQWKEPQTHINPIESYYYFFSKPDKDLKNGVELNLNGNNPLFSYDLVTGLYSFGPLPAAKKQGLNTIYILAKDDHGLFNPDAYLNDASGDGIKFYCETNAPSIPSGLHITDASDRGAENYALTVGWTALTNQPPDFDGYEIWKCHIAVGHSGCVDNSDFAKVATVSTNIYSEAGLTGNAVDYFYRVKSKDNVGNVSDLSNPVHRVPTGKFTTPPTVTAGPKSSAKAMSANITWSTNRVSNTVVEYGTTTNYGQEVSHSSESTTDHAIEIKGLLPGTTYHYKVQSIDRDYDYDPADAYSVDQTFTTLAAPGISEVNVTEIRLNSVIVTWKTTSSATSTILYGTTNGYGQTYTDSSSSQTTTHTVKIDKLTDTTTYHFKIAGTDVDGNNLSSDDYSFTTLTFPRLASLKVSQVTDASTATIKVGYDSNVPTTAQVVVSGNGGRDVSTYDLKNTHELTIANLRDNTSYTVEAKGRDQYGNEAAPLTQEFKTAFDTRPPLISNITTENSITGYGADAKGQIIVSWETDEPSTSQVQYETGVSGDSYSMKTQEDGGLTTTHVVVISGLKTSTAYHFSVLSKDASGNLAKSEDNSILTDQASSSILGLIVNSLQSTIGWIFSVFSKGQ